MQISDQLVKPLVERLGDEYRELDRELGQHSIEETESLKILIKKKLRYVESLCSDDPSNRSALHGNIHHTIRKLKLELRFAQRKWRRLLLNETRFKKQDKNEVPASFAA